jgi:glycine betaine transporter
VLPTVFSLFWFAALGGTGIWVELNGSGGLAALVSEEIATALFVFLDFMPFGTLLGAMAIFLIFIFLVTSADSGTFVISMMTSEGRLNPRTSLKLAWGTAITLLTLTILLSGSVEVAKAMAAFGAVPFTLILVLQLVAFLRALREEPAGQRAQQEAA